MHKNNCCFHVLFKVKLLVTSRTEIQKFPILHHMPLDRLDLQPFSSEDAEKLLLKTVRPVSEKVFLKVKTLYFFKQKKNNRNNAKYKDCLKVLF